ncbi:MAG: hypothetical protein H0V92_11625, partial [Pseudonocardiales bacterium]|nr:hypothetical protein [Pseudonocardiales bacterium]
MTEAAPLLAVHLAVFGADAGWAWPLVHRWCDTARREFRGQDWTTERLERALASVDLAEGIAAVGRGLVVEAEPPLGIARRLGLAEAEVICIRMLAGVRGVTEMTDVSRVALLVARQQWADVDNEAAALVVRAFGAKGSGSGDLDGLLKQVRRWLAAAGAGPGSPPRSAASWVAPAGTAIVRAVFDTATDPIHTTIGVAD